MMQWVQMLSDFRRLGGVAENVLLAEGKFGRGLFAIDKTKPVKLQVPRNLLMPAESLQIDNHGNLVLASSCDWSLDSKEFYLEYMRGYGLNASLIERLIEEQRQLFNLPVNVKQMLVNYGIDKAHFCEPGYQAALIKFKQSRQISIDGKDCLMPVVELVNHSGKSAHRFKLNTSVGIEGHFKDEILINYGTQVDALNFYTAYGFSEIKPYAFSGSLSLNLGAATLNIARLPNINQVIGEVKAPQLRLNGQVIDLSFLLLANAKHKTSPKIIFTQLMQQVGMPKPVAIEVFDGLVIRNTQFLQSLLVEMEAVKGSVAAGLKLAVKNQLAAYGIFH